jgi:hypothetical protein
MSTLHWEGDVELLRRPLPDGGFAHAIKIHSPTGTAVFYIGANVTDKAKLIAVTSKIAQAIDEAKAI